MTDLLGLLAYGQLQAFDQMSADARLAPDLTRRALLSQMAAAEIGNYGRLVDRLRELDCDPEEAMAPFVGPLSAYHDQTAPRDWLEALTKAYVGDGIADDFYREVAASVPPPDRELVLDVLHDTRYADFAADEIRNAIATDPRQGHRMSMWARRLVGEGLSQAQRVAIERPILAMMIAEGSDEGLAGLYKRVTSAHRARMAAVGLHN